MQSIQPSLSSAADVFNNPRLLESASGALLASKLFYQLKPSTKPILKNRRTVFFNSDRSSYNQNNVVIIEINSQDMLDVSNSYISFKMVPRFRSMTLGGGSTARLISNWKITGFGGVPLEEFSDVGLFQELTEKNSCDPGWLYTVGQAHGWRTDPTSQEYKDLFKNTLGAAGGASDNTDQLSSPATQTFILDLSFSGILGHVSQYLPLRHAGTLRVEITLNNADQAFTDTADHAAAVGGPQRDYKIHDVQYIADVVSLSDDVMRAITDHVNEGKMLISYPCVSVNNFNVNANETNTTLNLNRSVTDIRGVYAVPRNTTNLNSLAVNSFASLPHDDVEEWQFNLGTNYYPTRPINDSVNSYLYSSVRAFGRGYNNHMFPALSLIDYKTNSYHISCDFELDPSSSMTGENTRNGNFISLRLKLKSTAYAKTMTTYLLYTRVLNILPNNQLVINE